VNDAARSSTAPHVAGMKALDWATLLRLVALGVKSRLEVDDAQRDLI
jgi:hypothetical protein